MLHGLSCGEEAGARNLVFFRVKFKVPSAGDERYLLRAAVAAAVVSSANGFLLCVLQRVVGPVCVVLCVPLNLWLQIAVECDAAKRIVMAA